MAQRTGQKYWRALATFALGVAMAGIGTTVHRYHFELAGKWLAGGIVLTLLATVVASVFARAVADWLGVLTYAIGWFAVVMVLSLQGPGGDVLIVGDWLGYVWSYVGMLLAVSGLLVPRAWMSEQPRAPKVKAQVPTPATSQPGVEQGS